MGGDRAPEAPVTGAVAFARAHPDIEILLVGDVPRLDPLLRRVRPQNLSLHHAQDVVGMEASATDVRRRPDSSISVSTRLVREGVADAVVSAGHSGALLTAATLGLGRIEGVDRPAIAALLPALQHRRCLLVDAGANIECRPHWLAQFGVMGETYVRRVLGVERPRVGVLSNGQESGKGTPLTRGAAELLAHSDMDFLGYVEGSDLFSGRVDVVVTDGFSGNLVLKTAEGTALGAAGLVRQLLQRSGAAERLGGMLLEPLLGGMRRVLDSAEVGGAPLLGVQGVAMVSHGSATPRAIENALRAAAEMVRVDLQGHLADALRHAQGWLSGTPESGKPATEPGV